MSYYQVYEKKINDLVNLRNTIAHGEFFDVIPYGTESFFIDFMKIMEDTKDMILNMALQKKFLTVTS
jgi:hypothetical protein